MMNAIDPQLKRWLVWLAPFVVLALLIAWETDWGHEFKHVPPAETSVTPPPVTVALLPEYKLDGGVEARRETVDRTLFNPTRRPAPVVTAVAASAALRPGQFALTGTTVVDGKATAFLREVNGGRSRRVAQGETINGMLVAEVKPDRVRFTVGDQFEDLTLRVAAGPKTTIQPVAVAPPPPAGVPPAAIPAPTATAQPAGSQDVAEVLAARRRAARAAEAATLPAPATPPTAQPTTVAPAVVQQDTTAADPRWAETFQRMMNQRQQQK